MPLESLTREQKEILEIAGDLAERFAKSAAELDREGRFSVEHYEMAHETGYMRLTLPKEYGGWGANPHTFVLAQERLAQGCAGTAIAICMHLAIQGMFANTLSREQREEVFARAVDRRVSFAGGGTEMETGGSWTTLSPSARLDGRVYRLNAHKRFCSGCERADYFLCFLGMHDAGGGELIPDVSTFLVPASASGIEILRNWDSMGMRASGSHDLVLHDVEVPASAMIGRPRQGFGHAARWVYWFLFGESATYLGVAQAALDDCVRYVRQRHEKLQNTRLAPGVDRQLMIGRMTAQLESARAFLVQEARRFDEPSAMHRGFTSKLMARAAMAKYMVTETAIDVTNQALQIVGGFGYLRENSIERRYRDVRGGTFHPPRNTPNALSLAGHYRLGLNLDPSWSADEQG